MPKGGYRASNPGGRPKGSKDKKPRKGSKGNAEVDQLQILISAGMQAKKKIYHEFFVRVANKDGQQKPLSIVEKKMMDKLLDDIKSSNQADDTGNIPQTSDPDAKKWLEELLISPGVDRKTKIQVASILLPYQHPRKGEAGTGKKEEQADRAKVAGAGRFAPSKVPLSLVQ